MRGTLKRTALIPYSIDNLKHFSCLSHPKAIFLKVIAEGSACAFTNISGIMHFTNVRPKI